MDAFFLQSVMSSLADSGKAHEAFDSISEASCFHTAMSTLGFVAKISIVSSGLIRVTVRDKNGILQWNELRDLMNYLSSLTDALLPYYQTIVDGKVFTDREMNRVVSLARFVATQPELDQLKRAFNIMKGCNSQNDYVVKCAAFHEM